MKIVIYDEERTKSFLISEQQAHDYIEKISHVETKSEYELCRGYLDDTLLVIYKDNRVLRTKNSWFERRALAALSSHFDESYIHSYKTKWKGYDTEIDGITENKDIAVEVKRKTMTMKDVKFLSNKISDLSFDTLYILAPEFKSNCITTSNVQLVKFTPSWDEIRQYYNENFVKYDQFWNLSSQRHFRFLLANGRWQPQRRRYSDTAKWNVEDRLVHEINHYIKIGKGPIKIYYSLSRMVSPLREYEGDGRPMDLFIPVLDIDGEHNGNHIIGKEGYCLSCSDDAKTKLTALQETDITREFDLKILHSGTKGFHVYLLQDGELKEISKDKMESIVKSHKELVDPFLSKKSNEFDSHRIFKVPYTVDAGTGKIVSPTGRKLDVSDKLEFL